MGSGDFLTDLRKGDNNINAESRTVKCVGHQVEKYKLMNEIVVPKHAEEV